MRKFLYALTVTALVSIGLLAQQSGGSFLPGFDYDIAGAWNFSGTVPTLTGKGSVVGTTGTQTLTNKTLTSPTITSPTSTGSIYSGSKWRGTVTTYTGATDAIDISLGDVFVVNRSGAVDAATLAAPAAGDEGRTIIIQNGTTQANTIGVESTTGLGGSGTSYDLLTFTNVVAANCVLRAYGLHWYLIGGHLCAVS